MDPDERYIWATIRPSAVKSVAHMDSYFASLAAQDVGDCQQYFALVMEQPRGLSGPPTWIAFLVQPASQVPFLEETYLPIWPCRMGTREPLHPGFDWPFGDCVLYTGDLLEFVPNVVDTGRQPQVLPRPESERFIKLVMVDRRVMKRKSLEGHGTITEEREPTGCSSGCGSVRGDLSVSSTWLPVQPGQIFPPYVKIVAEVSYNMMMDNTGTPKNLEKERKRIMRIIARFYRVSTETTIIWALRIQKADLGSFILHDLNKTISDLTCPALVELASQFDRPLSPDRFGLPPPTLRSVPSESDQDDDWEEKDWELPMLSEPKLLAPPPSFDITSIRVIYFDIYDTLIDRETGIFAALRTLLARSPYGFDRHEALSFYFESEMEMKRRTPGARYAQILAESYDDLALRLGIPPVSTGDALSFAQSAQDWPLMPDADWLLYNIARIPGLSVVAIADVDHDFLTQTPAFSSLAPFFEVVFTWDACHAYKPDLAVFEPALRYYDAHRIPRVHSCIVSSGLLGDMEPARELGVPGVWMRYPGTLAANMHTVEDAAPAAAISSLSHLGMELLGATGARGSFGWPRDLHLYVDVPLGHRNGRWVYNDTITYAY